MFRVFQEKLKTCHRDVAELILETQLELTRLDRTAANFPTREELDEVIVIRNMSGDLSAMLVWRRLNDTIWIILAAVHPAFKGQRLHAQLHQELDKIARQLGIQNIDTYVAVENKEVLRSYEKMGVTPKMYYIQRKVT